MQSRETGARDDKSKTPLQTFLEELLSHFDRNHDGAALGASHHAPPGHSSSIDPYTARGHASIPNRNETLRRQSMLHTTYLYLAVAVAGCLGGAYFGANSGAVLRFLSSLGTFGFLGLFLALNFLPRMCMLVAEKNPRMAAPALGGFGIFAGLVISPMIFIGLRVSTGDASGGANLVSTAIVITGGIFAAVTAYIFMSKKEIRPSKAVGFGLLGFFFVAIPMGMFFHSPVLSLIISGVAGLIGVYQLAVGTSLLVTDPNFKSPAAGALILFAGVFNIFTTVLSLLLGGGDRD